MSVEDSSKQNLLDYVSPSHAGNIGMNHHSPGLEEIMTAWLPLFFILTVYIIFIVFYRRRIGNYQTQILEEQKRTNQTLERIAAALERQ